MLDGAAADNNYWNFVLTTTRFDLWEENSERKVNEVFHRTVWMIRNGSTTAAVAIATSTAIERTPFPWTSSYLSNCIVFCCSIDFETSWSVSTEGGGVCFIGFHGHGSEYSLIDANRCRLTQPLHLFLLDIFTPVIGLRLCCHSTQVKLRSGRPPHGQKLLLRKNDGWNPVKLNYSSGVRILNHVGLSRKKTSKDPIIYN